MAEKNSEIVNALDQELLSSGDYVAEKFHMKPNGRKTKTQKPDAMKTSADVPLPDIENAVMRAKCTLPLESFFRVTIVGRSPLLTNAPNPEVIDEIAKKQQGHGRVKKAPRSPEREFLLSAHLIHGKHKIESVPTNIYGYPAVGIKKSLLNSSYRQGDEKNKKANIGNFFVHGRYDGYAVINTPPEHPPVMRADVVKTTSGTLTPVYRAQYFPWSITFDIMHWPELGPTMDELLQWVILAGRHVGIGSRRIENSGELFGGFVLDDKVEVLPADYEPVFLHRQFEAIDPLVISPPEDADEPATPKKRGRPKKA